MSGLLLSALFLLGEVALGLPMSESQCDFRERYEKRADKVVFHKRGVGIKTVAVDVDGLNPAEFREILPPPIQNADGRPTYCNRVYATDGKNIYFRGDKMEGVAPSDFRALAGGYARTSTEVFWGDIPIPGAKVDTFKVIGWGKAHDGTSKLSKHQRE